jgi:hypothetical protein
MNKSYSVCLAVVAFVVGTSAAARPRQWAARWRVSQRSIPIRHSDHRAGCQREGDWHGSSGDSGVYDISGLQPGNYNFTLDPGSSGYQGQTVASYVGADGICLNWGVSTTSPAVATAQPGATCQGAAAAAAWDPAPWVGAGAVVVGGTAIGLGVGLGSGGDHSKHSKSTTE